MAVTEEFILQNIASALARRFSASVEPMPRINTSVGFHIHGSDGKAHYVAFTDSYIAVCANRGRQMIETDQDLVELFNRIEHAPQGKIAALSGHGEVVYLPLF